MRILLTNDDGIDAPGINVLAGYLEENKHQVTIVAPEKEKSASSHSITINAPLRVIKKKENRYAVTGSPADCIIIAFKVILKSGCDLVISGINNGPNLGEDVLYSGTVAAAIEAMYFGFPAIAVSLCSKTINRFETAAHYISLLLDKNIQETISANEILNINVPAIPIEEIKGIKIAKTGMRKYNNFVTEKKDINGERIFWLGGDSPEWSNEDDTDIVAVRSDCISITPVAPNFTNFKSFGNLTNWLNRIKCSEILTS